MKLKFLEYRGSIEILKSLYPDKKMLFTDLLWKLKREARMGQSTVYRTLEILVEEGLVNEERVPERSRARLLSLTEKGKLVTKLLIDLEKQI